MLELKYAISELMLFHAIIAFATALYYIARGQVKDTVHRLFVFMLLSSMVWSLGFSMLYIQTEVPAAHFWKSFAIAGTVGFMIASQSLTNAIAGFSRKATIFFQMVSLLGIPVYILSVRPSQTTYYISKRFGFMTYTFHSGIINILYTGYFIVVSLNILYAVIKMLVSKEYARLRSYGVKFLVVLILIIAGTVFDLVFPALGLDSLPGSNVTQFLGVAVVFLAIRDLDKNRINVENMAEYMYYSIKEPIIIADDTTRVRIANKAGREFFNLQEDGYGYTVTLSQILELPDDGFFENGTRAVNYELKDKIKHRPCAVGLSRINDRHGDTIGYIAVVRDVSERVRYIDELKAARAEAELSNTTKTTFLANMSHEIRTPMNSIIGFTEILLKQEMSRDEQTEYMENIRDSAYDLLKLINEILDITKVESGKVTVNNNTYNLEKMLDSVLAQIVPQAKKKGLELKVDFAPDLPSVINGDETKGREILVNVLNNAVKYTNEGSITFRLTADIAPGKKSAVFVAEISDTGVGIKQEELDSIFMPFEQVNKNLHSGIEGTGLGLAIVKGYTDVMGGKIEVTSKYGEGTTFRITLVQDVVDATPFKGSPEKRAAGKSRIGELRFPGKRVLVVDDNLINLKVAGKTLECYGLTVDMAESGAKAIEMCKEAEYPIVFIDQMMPEMDGIETMNRIRGISEYYRQSAKLVALTANALVEARSRLLSEGFDEYLKKPIEFDMLEALLEQFFSDRA
ncbi:MAG: response regulator [Lachnospiraceae bacterium]|nr:response regulator [Lachnospiraceae bacterium]